MKKKMFKKTLAGMLATTMVLGMSMSALADDQNSGSVTGNGDFEGHVAKKVVAVTLPTATATTFAYKMDPEGLIAATENAKYSGATFESGANVYFQSAENTYTKDSAKLKVINKGTADVDVTILAKTADNSNITMVNSEADFTGTDAQLYLGLKVADETVVPVTDESTEGGEKIVGLKGNSANFEITYDANSGYGYTAKTGVPDTAWNSFEFGLTGACNPNGDYSASGLAASNVEVTWSYAERADDSANTMLGENATADAAPTIATTTYTATANSPVSVNVNLGAGNKIATGIDSIKNVATNAVVPTARYSFSGNTLTIDATFIKNNMAAISSGSGLNLSVVFNDTAKTAVTITLTAATE